MDRIPEPELMDDPAQALAYAQADFAEPHQRFVELFRERLPGHVPHSVLDLGCGPADVTLRFARAFPDCRVTGVDGARAMLDLGRTAIAAAGLAGRIGLIEARLPLSRPLGQFDTLISNSLLHHLADPSVLWDSVRAHAQPGAAVFVMDLMRPASRAAAEALVQAHALGAPDILRRDFLHSLCAAFEPAEIRAQLLHAGLALAVEAVSDRHVLIWGSVS